MEALKNSGGKMICRVDCTKKVVEIKLKDIVTTIRFLEDGTIEVINKAA